MATVLDANCCAAREEPPAEAADDLGALGLVELILKRRDRLDRLIREPGLKASLVPRFLAIALVSFALYGLAMSMVFSAASIWLRLTAPAEILYGGGGSPLVFTAFEGNFWRPWLDGSALVLVAAYTFGLIAASGICLPSLYFSGLLAGVRMSMLDVVLHTLKAKATAAVALIGLLPIYAALALGIAILPAPTGLREAIYWLGLILPFLAGLWGTWSLYRGFVGLADALPDSCRNRRMCFLRRLVAAWAACYSAVTPVLIFTFWQRLS
jgi:hypothetical protein